MLLISHRGNISGPNSCVENSLEAIQNAIDAKYNVEIDLHVTDNKLLLGHDFGEYQVNLNWLIERKDNLWIHCKNKEALELVNQIKNLNYFWHQEDYYTLTSKNYVWAYPGIVPISNTVMVMPELKWTNYVDAVKKLCPFGVCSDYIEAFR